MEALPRLTLPERILPGVKCLMLHHQDPMATPMPASVAPSANKEIFPIIRYRLTCSKLIFAFVEGVPFECN